MWWDELEQRAGELQGRQVGWEGSVDVVCGANQFLSQLETLKNVIDPGDEQGNTGTALAWLNGEDEPGERSSLEKGISR